MASLDNGLARRVKIGGARRGSVRAAMSSPFGPVVVALAFVVSACGGSAGPESGSGGSGGDGGQASTSSSSKASAGGGGAGTGAGGAANTGGAGGDASADLDGDGIPDAEEERLAKDYLPFLSTDPADGCPLSGILYRVRPHPDDPTLVTIVYDHLYQDDCGSFGTGHVGDDEAFGVTIDPTQPAPDGIVSMIAVGHQNTACEADTQCGRCSGQSACDTTPLHGKSWPVVFAGKDKHANYVQEDKCSLFTSCLDMCTLAPTPQVVPMVNAGEPDHHFVDDLTTQAFVNEANGWTKTELFHVNPWDASVDFGGAGAIGGDLVDDAFVPPACH
jgi:hypothetical protein